MIFQKWSRSFFLASAFSLFVGTAVFSAEAGTRTGTVVQSRGGLSDHVYYLDLWIGWDYHGPSDSLTYVFEVEIETDNTIAEIQFTTPGGNTYTIPKTASSQPAAGVETEWFDHGDGNYEWCYCGEFSSESELADYGDGDYVFTFEFSDESTAQTTIDFGIPGTTDDIPQPTQEPVVLTPGAGDTVTSPVLFTWEPCTDANATSIYVCACNEALDVDDEVSFSVDDTHRGPIMLTAHADWELEMGFEQGYEATNADGITYWVGKSSEVNIPFEVIDRTDGTISVGQTAYGVISQSQEIDTYAFGATAGDELVIDLNARALYADLDAVLRLLGPDSAVIATDDEGGDLAGEFCIEFELAAERRGNAGTPEYSFWIEACPSDPRIYFTAPTTGTYTVEVGSFENVVEGDDEAECGSSAYYELRLLPAADLPASNLQNATVTLTKPGGGAEALAYGSFDEDEWGGYGFALEDTETDQAGVETRFPDGEYTITADYGNGDVRTRTFTLGGTWPACPAITNPVDNATDVAEPVQATWQTVTDADWLGLELIDPEQDTDDGIWDEGYGADTTSATIPADETATGTLYRIRLNSCTGGESEEAIEVAKYGRTWLEVTTSETESTFSIGGSVSYTGTANGPLTVCAYESDDFMSDTPVAQAGHPAPDYPQSYTITGLPAGTYYLLGFIDIDEDGYTKGVDPVGFLDADGEAGPDGVQVGPDATNVDFEIFDPDTGDSTAIYGIEILIGRTTQPNGTGYAAFEFEAETSTDVIKVEFEAPNGGTGEILSGDSEGDGESDIETEYYEEEDGHAYWEYEHEMADMTTLMALYGDGDYTVRFWFAGGKTVETVLTFLAADGVSSLPQPTQEPNFTTPTAGATDVPVDVTFEWDVCTDANANALNVECEKEGDNGGDGEDVFEEQLSVSTTTYSPETELEGGTTYGCALEFGYVRDFTNDDGIDCWIAKYSMLEGVEFTTAGGTPNYHADFDFDTYYRPGSGVDTFAAGAYPIYPRWWLGLENDTDTSVDVGTVIFDAEYALNDLEPAPDSTNGTAYTWTNVTIPPQDELNFEGSQSSVQVNADIPVTVTRDWNPRVLTESGDVTVTVTVTPQSAQTWDELWVEIGLFNSLHDGYPDGGQVFATLSNPRETHSPAAIWDGGDDTASEQWSEWKVTSPTAGEPLTFTYTVYYALGAGVDPVMIEPSVDVAGHLAADNGSEAWSGETLDLGASNGSVKLSSAPSSTADHVPWLGVDFHSSAIEVSANNLITHVTMYRSREQRGDDSSSQGAFFEVGVDAIEGVSLRFTPPASGGRSPVMLQEETPGSGYYAYEDDGLTVAELDTFYPLDNGGTAEVYRIEAFTGSVDGSPEQVVEVTFTDAGGVLLGVPSQFPALTVPAPVGEAVQAVPDQTYSWAPYSAGDGNANRIHFSICDCQEDEDIAGVSRVVGESTTYSPGSIDPGTDYEVELSFLNVRETTSSDTGPALYLANETITMYDLTVESLQRIQHVEILNGLIHWSPIQDDSLIFEVMVRTDSSPAYVTVEAPDGTTADLPLTSSSRGAEKEWEFITFDTDGTGLHPHFYVNGIFTVTVYDGTNAVLSETAVSFTGLTRPTSRPVMDGETPSLILDAQPDVVFSWSPCNDGISSGVALYLSNSADEEISEMLRSVADDNADDNSFDPPGKLAAGDYTAELAFAQHTTGITAQNVPFTIIMSHETQYAVVVTEGTGEPGSSYHADFDFDTYYRPGSGVNTFASGTYPIYPRWWLGLENGTDAPVDVGTVIFDAEYALNDLDPDPDSTNGTAYTWTNVTIPPYDELNFEGSQSSVQVNADIPVTVTRDWNPRVLTESGDVTVTVTVTPQSAQTWDELWVEIGLFNSLHDGYPDGGQVFATLSNPRETHSPAAIWDGGEDTPAEQWSEWKVASPTSGEPLIFTYTVYYALGAGVDPVMIEPSVDVAGHLTADNGSEAWSGGTLDLGASNGSVQLSSAPSSTADHVPWLGVDFHSSAVTVTPVFTDDFNDNTTGTEWYLLTDAPDKVWLDETNGRLEARATTEESFFEATYAGRGWNLDPNQDFAMQIDWHFGSTSVVYAGLYFGVMIPSLYYTEQHTYIDLGVQYDSSSGSEFYMYGEAKNEPSVDYSTISRTAQDGTLYISYEASTDTLYMSVNGYGRPEDTANGDWVVSGILQGEWEGQNVTVDFGCYSGNSGDAIDSGDAYYDNFVLLEGTQVTPPTRQLTVSSFPEGAVSIAVRPDDNTGTGDGVTPLSRTYDVGIPVSLTAPATDGSGNPFVMWFDGDEPISWEPSLKKSLTSDMALIVVYNTDLDADTMSDWWEMQIVDADPNDAIDDYTDVLAGDDFDGDGLTNEREFVLNTDPTTPDGILVWFDKAHDDGHGGFPETLGTIQMLFDAPIFTVLERQESITYAELQDFSLLILSDCTTALADTEITAIQQFHDAGGSVWIASPVGFFLFGNLLDKYGISLKTTSMDESPDTFGNHPVTEGVTGLPGMESFSTIEGGDPLFWYSGSIGGVANENSGGGRLVVFGDSEFMAQEPLEANSERLLTNARDWLCKIASAHIILQPGWNAVSLPVRTLDPVTGIFSSEVTGASLLTGAPLYWDPNTRTYQAFGDDDLVPALTGMWAYSKNGGECRTVIGQKVSPDVVLEQGWNFLGPAEMCPLPVDAGLASAAWEWNTDTQRYEAVKPGDPLETGKAYWFRVSEQTPMRLGTAE